MTAHCISDRSGEVDISKAFKGQKFRTSQFICLSRKIINQAGEAQMVNFTELQKSSAKAGVSTAPQGSGLYG